MYCGGVKCGWLAEIIYYVEHPFFVFPGLGMHFCFLAKNRPEGEGAGVEVGGVNLSVFMKKGLRLAPL